MPAMIQSCSNNANRLLDVTTLCESSFHSTVSVGRSKKFLADGHVEEDSQRYKNSRRERKVNFKPSVRVRKIPPHRHLTEAEKASIWYSQDDVKQIRKDIIATVKRMMKGEDVDTDGTSSSRGLEFKEPKKNRARQNRKQEIACAVLAEQECLWEDGREDFEALLAEVYVSCNWECAVEARKRGIADELATR
mmetsp:Transcript_30323/g.50381  ORF Transcript_30323/g.50381 Transcript_30323/m.50381 type:complete len:192 (+) Transcript_30323:189-764(+)